MTPEKERQMYKEIIDKMFEIAGHPLKFEDVETREDNWFQQYTMTTEQNREWREWGAKLLAKRRRYGKKMAEKGMAWIDLYCGLKISDHEKNK